MKQIKKEDIFESKQISKIRDVISDASISLKNLCDQLNKLKNQEEMKITEDTRIKDLIPEGYELDGNKAWKLDTDEEMCIPLKKKEVKDFNWYIKQYIKNQTLFESINTENCKWYYGDPIYFPFEIKIGLLKFICDDLGLGLLDVLNDKLELYEKVKIESIVPQEFLNSIFE